MKIKVGTRGSLLAQTQTNMVVDALSRVHPTLELEIVEILTGGDRKQGTAKAAVKDKKEWIDDIETAVINGEIDVAVHSGKDVPCDIDERTELLPILARENPADSLIFKGGKKGSIADLPEGAVVGTASLRRKSQLLNARPDLKIVDHRGNVPTRLRKLEDSEDLSAIVLAESGIKRLSIDVPRHIFDFPLMMPAMSQGTLVVQFARGRDELKEHIMMLVDPINLAAWTAERAFIEKLGADCHSSVCVYGTVEDETLTLSGRVLSPDGKTCIEDTLSEDSKDFEALGVSLADGLLSRGAGALLELSRKESGK